MTRAVVVLVALGCSAVIRGPWPVRREARHLATLGASSCDSRPRSRFFNLDRSPVPKGQKRRAR